MRLKRIRVSRKNVLKWFLENYGVGGVENYDQSQIYPVLQSIKTILEEADSIELDFIAKTLLKLSDNPILASKFYEELEEEGIESFNQFFEKLGKY